MSLDKIKKEKRLFQPRTGPKTPERLEWEAIKAAAQRRELENRLKQNRLYIPRNGKREE